MPTQINFEYRKQELENAVKFIRISINPLSPKRKAFSNTKFVVINQKPNIKLIHNQTRDIQLSVPTGKVESVQGGKQQQVDVLKRFMKDRFSSPQNLDEMTQVGSSKLQIKVEENQKISGMKASRSSSDRNMNPCEISLVSNIESSQILSNCTNKSQEIIEQLWFQLALTKNVNPKLVELCINSLKQISVCFADQVVNTADGHGNTVLHYAVSQASWPIVATILTNCPKVDVNMFNHTGYTPLMLAAVLPSEPINKNDMDTLDLMVSRANLNLKSQNEREQTVLILAAMHGHLKDNEGCTALDIALDKQNHEIALLIYAKMKVQKLNCRSVVCFTNHNI
ncbi:unnamed protein product [Heterobilharzia americana]|nr:unnamed protein product [Heterobilharzia americana]